jgi:solute carrier family 31 (copper transporter), member 1
MTECGSYTSLCNNPASVVQQCATSPPIPGLPTTAEASDAIRTICQAMPTEACGSCQVADPDLKCDVLTVYSTLCLAMPTMADCAAWSDMCTSIGGWSFCGGGHDHAATPMMLPYFHAGITEYVLFQKWVTSNNAQYFGALVFVFFLSLSLECLQTVRAKLEWRWSQEVEANTDVKSSALNDASASLIAPKVDWVAQPFRLKVELGRSGMRVLEGAVDLLIMMVIMTFNVGFFFAILCGLFVGSFALSRHRKYVAKSSCC